MSRLVWHRRVRGYAAVGRSIRGARMHYFVQRRNRYIWRALAQHPDGSVATSRSSASMRDARAFCERFEETRR